MPDKVRERTLPIPSFPFENNRFRLPKQPDSCGQTDLYCQAINKAHQLDTNKDARLTLREFIHDPAVWTPALRDILRKSLAKAYQQQKLSPLLKQPDLSIFESIDPTNEEQLFKIESLLGLMPPVFLPKIYKATSDEYLKAELLVRIGSLYDPSFIPFLRKVAKEASEERRDVAIITLGDLGDVWLIQQFSKEVREGVADNPTLIAISALAYKNDKALSLLIEAHKKLEQQKEALLLNGPEPDDKRHAYANALDENRHKREVVLAGLANSRRREALPILLDAAFRQTGQHEEKLDLFLQIGFVSPDEMSQKITPYLEPAEPFHTRLKAAKYLLKNEIATEVDRQKIREIVLEGIRQEDPGVLNIVEEYHLEDREMISLILQRAQGTFLTYKTLLFGVKPLFTILARHIHEEPAIAPFFETVYRQEKYSRHLYDLLIAWKPHLPPKEWTQKVLGLLTRPPRTNLDVGSRRGGLPDAAMEFVGLANRFPQVEFVAPALSLVARTVEADPTRFTYLLGSFDKIFTPAPEQIGTEWFARLDRFVASPLPDAAMQDERLVTTLYLLSFASNPQAAAKMIAHLPMIQKLANGPHKEIIDDLLLRSLKRHPEPFYQLLVKIADPEQAKLLLSNIVYTEDPAWIPRLRTIEKSHPQRGMRRAVQATRILLGDLEGMEEAIAELRPLFSEESLKEISAMAQTSHYNRLFQSGGNKAVDEAHTLPLELEEIHERVDPRTGLKLTGQGQSSIIIDPDFPGLHGGGGLSGRMRVEEASDLVPIQKRLRPVPGREPQTTHGVNIASVLAGETTGVAPGSRVIGINLPFERMTFHDWVDSLSSLYEWAARQKEKDPSLRVINISVWSNQFLGGQDVAVFQQSPQYQRLQANLDRLEKVGILLVVGAGNRNIDEWGPLGNLNFWGLFEEKVLVVGASDTRETAEAYDDEVASFSSRAGHLGQQSLLIAPGSDVLVATPDNKYEITSGTSFAAPFVAGLIQIMYQVNPSLRPEEVRRILRLSAHHLTGFSEKEEGAGQIDPRRAIALAAFAESRTRGQEISEALGLSQSFNKP